MDYVTHVFHEVFLHFNWHCHQSRPMIRPQIEPNLYAYIRDYCHKSKGVFFHGIGGTETHVHLVVQIEPFVRISELAQKLKGASSHEVNVQFGRNALRWQRGYGVASFARKNLKAVVDYVQNQKKHHRQGTTRKILEECGEKWGGARTGGNNRGYREAPLKRAREGKV